MHFPRLASTVVLALSAAACSDDRDPGVVVGDTMTNPNQPAANAGSSGGGSAGAAGAPTGNTGGSAAEAPPNPMLNQGGAANSGGGNMTPGAAGMAGMANTPPPAQGDAGAAEDDEAMSFFLTSRGSGNGGNFGGIAGADAFCTMLAVEGNAANGNKTWRAYLSTSTQNARDRIGTGPWRNAAGVIIANNVAQLHDQAAGGASEATYPLNNINTALQDNGMPLPAQPVFHDILTGSNLDGTVSATGTCSDWTAATGMTRNGHSNRAGGGQNPSSWNSAHDTGCAEPNPAGSNFQAGSVSQGGGRGQIYCFAID